MTTVIGLLSGREFVVKERFYPFFNRKTGIQTNVFISENGKRTITVPADRVEFYDEPLDKNMKTGFETLDVNFFSLDELPELSKPRNTSDQIKMMFAFHTEKRNWPHID